MFLGGISAERAVSLRTGAAVAAALRRKGYDVREIDIREDWLGTVRDAGVDAAFIALHGRFGGDGCIQAACELARLPYTGSGVAASAVAMSKMLGKRMAAAAGVPCPPDEVYEGSEIAGAKPPPFGFPLVVKPDREGSTVGVTIVRSAAEWEGALDLAARHDSRVIAEGYVAGREITVSIVNGRVFPAIEIVPKSGFYDYNAKYSKGETEYVIRCRWRGTSCSAPRNTPAGSPRRCGCAARRGSTTGWTGPGTCSSSRRTRSPDDRDEPASQGRAVRRHAVEELVEEILSDAGCRSR